MIKKFNSNKEYESVIKTLIEINTCILNINTNHKIYLESIGKLEEYYIWIENFKVEKE